MEYLAFHQSINQLEIKPLYLVLGSEKFLRMQTIEMILKKLGGDNIFYKEYHGDNDVNWNFIWNDLYSEALFEDFSLIVLRDADKSLSRLQEQITSYIQSPPKTASFIIELEKLDQRLKFGQFLKQHSFLIQCSPLKEIKSGSKGSELSQWIKLQAEKYNKKIRADANQMLCELLGNNLQDIDSHLIQLVTNIQNRTEITAEDIKKTIQGLNKVDVFEFLDTIFSENLAKSLQMSYQLFSKGLQGKDGKVISDSTGIALQFLRLVHYRIRQLWQIGVAHDSSVQEFIRRKLYKQINQFPEKRLKKIWSKALETEINIKVKGMNPQFAIEELIQCIITLTK